MREDRAKDCGLRGESSLKSCGIASARRILRMKRIRHSQRRSGFSLLEAIIVCVILAVLIAVFLPSLLPAKRQVNPLYCVNNLKQIGLSFRQWGQDNNDKYPDQVSVTNGGTMELVRSGIAYVNFLVLSNELNTPKVLVCPADTDHIAATNWTSLRNGNLSYFIGLDAAEAVPQKFLSGDDNFTVNGLKPKSGVLELWTNSTIAWLPTRHAGQGNVALTDGSVQGLSSAGFQRALVGTGTATNRLLMP
jgi:prepilin-type processing-associated H-X9-DG protein